MDNKEIIINQDKNQLTQQNIDKDAQGVIDMVKAGELNPLDVYLQASYVKKIAETVLKGIKEDTFNEIDNYGSQPKDRIKYGANFSRRAGYPKFNFDVDQEYNDLAKELEKRKMIMKEAYKSKTKGITAVDENGEMVPTPEVTGFVEDSIIIKFGK